MLHHVRRLFPPTSFFFLFLLLGVFGLALGYEYMQTIGLEKRINALSSDLASTTAVMVYNTNQLSQKFTDLTLQTTGISQNIDAVKNQVGGVEQFVGSISGTVNSLQKLSEIDPQLLKKYSKVYFTNENYVPAHLTVISTDYIYSTARQEQFLTEATPFLNSMLSQARMAGNSLYVKSAYRSFAEQKSLKSAYSVTYGAGTANSFSADQGYSEHQLGTAVDLITTGTNGSLTGFDKTTSYTWLLANAFRYGFVLSYPKGNAYYVYEPWHWRFVGVKLATYLFTNHLNFYDMDQREIDKYLGSTFD